MWADSFNVWSVAICILCTLVAISAALRATLALESLHRKLRSVESQQRSMQTSLSEYSETLEGLAQRVKMQRVRNATNHIREKNSDPDPYTSPDEWRKAINRRLAIGKQR